MQRPIRRNIIRIPPMPQQQPRILHPPHRLRHPKFRHRMFLQRCNNYTAVQQNCQPSVQLEFPELAAHGPGTFVGQITSAKPGAIRHLYDPLLPPARFHQNRRKALHFLAQNKLKYQR
jgi:hypothetical protein